MTYYHVDRSGLLSPGQIIDLNKTYRPNNHIHEEYFIKMFPNGVSKHGEYYLNDCMHESKTIDYINEFKTGNDFLSTTLMENFFELVRRSYFPDKTSRFCTLFALETPDEISKWEQFNENMPIFEINTDIPGQKYDANLLYGGTCFFCDNRVINDVFHYTQTIQGYSPALNLDFAFKYWNQELSGNPKPEILLPLPITIGKRVK